MLQISLCVYSMGNLFWYKKKKNYLINNKLFGSLPRFEPTTFCFLVLSVKHVKNNLFNKVLCDLHLPVEVPLYDISRQKQKHLYRTQSTSSPLSLIKVPFLVLMKKKMWKNYVCWCYTTCHNNSTSELSSTALKQKGLVHIIKR